MREEAMTAFIPGLRLGELFYHEAARPVLQAEFPGLAHSAALIGSGSEVLGFDTEISMDHDWGPRVMLFLAEEEHARHAAPIREAMRQGLPRQFRDYPTEFAPSEPAGGAAGHRVET